MTLRFPVSPMKAVLGELPPVGQDDQWAYEVKWDGYRTLLFVLDGAVRVQSSSGLDMTARYPELAGIAPDVNAASAILDGEIVVFDRNGRPRFEHLQRHESQVVFQAFDVLSIDGADTIAIPYEQRRALLADLVEQGPNWSVPAHRIGGGAELLAATGERSLEGVMAKRLGSSYQPGKRTSNWRKVKHRLRVDVVIGGITEGTGSRASSFGALLVGLSTDDGRLRFAGGIGTGFDARTLNTLTARFKALRTPDCPFDPLPPREYRRGAQWLEPTLTATVEIAEFTNEGLVRHGSFIGLRS